MKPATRFIFLGLIILCCLRVTAQQDVYNDSISVFSLLKKAEDYFNNSDYANALQTCDRAKAISIEKNYLRGEAFSIIKTADILIEKGDYVAAKDLPQATFKIGAKLKDSLIMAISYLHSAQLNMNTDKFDEALSFFDKALKLKLNKLRSAYSGLAWNDMGYTYGLKGDLQKQAECLMTSLRQYESIENQPGMAMVLSNLSGLFNNMGEKEKAISYAKRAIEIREKINDYFYLSISCCNLSQLYIGVNAGEAEKYRQLCVKYALLSKDVKRMAHSYVSSSLMAINQRKFNESLEYELKAIELLEKNNLYEILLARRYIMAGTSSAEMHTDSTASVLYYHKGINLAKKLNDKFTIRDAYLHQAIFYKERKDFYNAYENIKKFHVYKDSIISENTRSDIAEIETKYETEKKDQQIFQLNTAQRIRQLEIEKQKAVISGNMLEAMQKENEIKLLSKSRELQQVLISQQDKELEKQVLLTKNNEQQFKLSEQAKQLQSKQLQSQKLLRNVMIAAIGISLILGYFLFNRFQLKKKLQQQNELLAVRNSIAKDLHDDIGSTLTSIKILSEVSKNNIDKDREKASSFLQKITEQSSEMEQGMSDIVWAIKPDNDKLENMVIRMREYISHTLELKNIKTIFRVDENILTKSIGMQQRKDLFLIFKEAINNASKYSNAANVNISLESIHGNVLLSVSDDGIGFDTAKSSSSNGLKNINARAKALNGIVDIVSLPGKGTSVNFIMPAT
ncbi:MAG: histidine kinase [Ferruginibacter sp.]